MRLEASSAQNGKEQVLLAWITRPPPERKLQVNILIGVLKPPEGRRDRLEPTGRGEFIVEMVRVQED